MLHTGYTEPEPACNACISHIPAIRSLCQQCNATRCHTGLCNVCTIAALCHIVAIRSPVSAMQYPVLAVLCHILPIQRPVSAVPCCVLAAPCHLLVIGSSMFVGIPCQRLHHRGLLSNAFRAYPCACCLPTPHAEGSGRSEPCYPLWTAVY